MNKRLSDSEIKVLNILWEKGTVSAKDVCAVAEETIGWNKNTTYTVLTKMVARGIIKRDEPGFLCTAMVSEKDAQKIELESVLARIFRSSKKALFSTLFEDEKLTKEELAELHRILDNKE